jgi:hypothetical protein
MGLTLLQGFWDCRESGLQMRQQCLDLPRLHITTPLALAPVARIRFLPASLQPSRQIACQASVANWEQRSGSLERAWSQSIRCRVQIRIASSAPETAYTEGSNLCTMGNCASPGLPVRAPGRPNGREPNLRQYEFWRDIAALGLIRAYGRPKIPTVQYPRGSCD